MARVYNTYQVKYIKIQKDILEFNIKGLKPVGHDFPMNNKSEQDLQKELKMIELTFLKTDVLDLRKRYLPDSQPQVRCFHRNTLRMLSERLIPALRHN